MPDWLSRQATLNPHGPALVDRDVRLSWRQLDAAAGRFAATLRRAGIAAGDRVGLLAANSWRFAVAVHGCQRSGAVLVPLNTRLTEPEIAFQFRTGELALVVADDALRSLVKGSGFSVMTLDEFMATVPDGSGQSARSAEIDLSTVHSVVFTSGTTGTPKGAQLTYGSWHWGAIGSCLHLGHLPTDRWLATLPLFHVGGLAILYRSAITGAPVQIHDRFEPDRVNHALDNDTTLVSLVPTMVQWLLDARRGRRFPVTLRVALVGGAAAAPNLVDRARAAGLPVAPTYGLTEAASQVATLRPDQVAAHRGTSGQPLPVTDVRIEGEAGEPGEIAIRGRTLMRGYLGPESGLDADGWFRTGDIGHLDELGFLTVLDRRDDLIVSGGENISPTEVEAALLAHPGVAEAAVVGRADPTWGAVPVAAVVLRPGTELDPSDLLRHARQSLAGFKVPKGMLVVDRLPRTASGKIRRSDVRALFAAPSDQP